MSTPSQQYFINFIRGLTCHDSRSMEAHVFIIRCNAWQIKPLWRVIVDAVLTYLIPIGFSGFLYFKMIRVLRSQQTHASRNRNLSICFFTSWCLWVICWAPKIAIGLMQIPTRSASYSLGEVGNKIMVYLFFSVSAIQMLYAQLNPIMYLILFKKFQKRVFGTLKLLLFVRNTHQQNMQVSRSEESSGNVKWGDRLKFGILILSSLCCLWGSVGVGATLGTRVHVQTETSTVVYTRRELSIMTWQFKTIALSYADAVDTDSAYATRSKCSVNRGTLSFEYKKCSFVVEHIAPGLNFSEQVKTCEARGAILSYPRTFAEIGSMWDFFERERNELPRDSLLRLSLHAGYVRHTPVVTKFPQFESVDGSYVIDSKRNKHLFNDVSLFRNFSGYFTGGYIFKGPAVCFSKAKQLDECMPRSKKPFSICSISLIL